MTLATSTTDRARRSASQKLESPLDSPQMAAAFAPLLTSLHAAVLRPDKSLRDQAHRTMSHLGRLVEPTGPLLVASLPPDLAEGLLASLVASASRQRSSPQRLWKHIVTYLVQALSCPEPCVHEPAVIALLRLQGYFTEQILESAGRYRSHLAYCQRLLLVAERTDEQSRGAYALLHSVLGRLSEKQVKLAGKRVRSDRQVRAKPSPSDSKQEEPSPAVVTAKAEALAKSPDGFRRGRQETATQSPPPTKPPSLPLKNLALTSRPRTLRDLAPKPVLPFQTAPRSTLEAQLRIILEARRKARQ